MTDDYIILDRIRSREAKGERESVCGCRSALVTITGWAIHSDGGADARLK